VSLPGLGERLASVIAEVDQTQTCYVHAAVLRETQRRLAETLQTRRPALYRAPSATKIRLIQLNFLASVGFWQLMTERSQSVRVAHTPSSKAVPLKATSTVGLTTPGELVPLIFRSKIENAIEIRRRLTKLQTKKN